jgi:acetate kinase
LRILVVNAGSSSLKLRLLDDADRTLAERDLDGSGGRLDVAGLESAISEAGKVDAVGHRVVHGGDRFAGPVRIDAGVERYLSSLTELAPLQQPPSLKAIAETRRLLPEVPSIACFDTAFHRRLPAAAATYAIPADWRRRWGIRRYGFHGLSYAYASRRAVELLATPPESLRLVICHLGSGASLAAVSGGRSVDTTMGFTPLEGLVMGTRSGNVDPGLLIWLLRERKLGLGALEEGLVKESGLKALAGTADMREVLAAGAAGRAAVEVYLHRLRALIAAMAAAMNGLEALVFTGGVGEHAAPIRAGAAEGLGFLGIAVDPTANEASGDREITAPGAAVRTLVIAAREDLEIARQVRELLAAR